MIAKLTGLLAETGEDHAVVDVGGVGYLVSCSGKTLARLRERGQIAHLGLTNFDTDLSFARAISAAVAFDVRKTTFAASS